MTIQEILGPRPDAGGHTRSAASTYTANQGTSEGTPHGKTGTRSCTSTRCERKSALYAQRKIIITSRAELDTITPRLLPRAKRIVERLLASTREDRHEWAAKRRRAAVTELDDGMSELIANLPIVQAAGIFHRLTQVAKTLVVPTTPVASTSYAPTASPPCSSPDRRPSRTTCQITRSPRTPAHPASPPSEGCRDPRASERGIGGDSALAPDRSRQTS